MVLKFLEVRNSGTIGDSIMAKDVSASSMYERGHRVFVFAF